MTQTSMAHSDSNSAAADDRKRSAHEIYQQESRQVLKSVTNILAVDLMWSLVGLKS
ncbi:hypothetical protein [Geitlerinema sp. P-1104]|uniref:hypothetical protein n=1 Tax=Geitlerinema sp. P-1104 TaxID=2546230 RepID=UPI001476A775|nr:hypothetical protein [Geitlerinema sp. P-1104]